MKNKNQNNNGLNMKKIIKRLIIFIPVVLCDFLIDLYWLVFGESNQRLINVAHKLVTWSL